MKEFWKTAAGVAGLLASIAFVIGVSFNIFIEPLQNDLRSLGQKVDRFDDPETGYPKAVEKGVATAVASAIQQDQAIQVTIRGEVSDRLAEAMENQRKSLDKLREEVVGALHEQRQSFAQEIQNQTRELTEGLGRLENDLEDVQYRQNILLKRMLGNVPKDPKIFMEKGLWADTPFTLAPLWVIDKAGYKTLIQRAQDQPWPSYKIEAIKQ